MVREDIHHAPLASRVRSLHVHDDILPRQTRSRLIVPLNAPHRRRDRACAVLLANFTSAVPFVEVWHKLLPIARLPQYLVRLARRSVRVCKGTVAVVEEPATPGNTTWFPWNRYIWYDRHPSVIVCLFSAASTGFKTCAPGCAAGLRFPNG